MQTNNKEYESAIINKDYAKLYDLLSEKINKKIHNKIELTNFFIAAIKLNLTEEASNKIDIFTLIHHDIKNQIILLEVLVRSSRYKLVIPIYEKMKIKNENINDLLGSIHRKNGDKIKSYRYHEKACLTNNEIFLSNYSVTATYFGDHKRALVIISKIKNLKEKSIEIKLNYLNILINNKNYYNAQNFINNLNSIEIKDSRMVNILLQALIGQNNIIEAIKISEEIINNYYNIPLLKTISNMLFSVGEIERALNIYMEIFTKTNEEIWLSNYYFATLHSDKFNKEKLFLEHKKYSSLIGNLDNRVDIRKTYKIKLLNIGFISADFRSHAVSRYLISHLKLLKNNYNVYLYSNNYIEDEMTEELKRNSFKFRVIKNINDNECVNIINNDEIQILIDLSGHTSGNRLRLFSLKPAPIQISWLGYPYTTGLKEIDYYITDEIIAPKGLLDSWFTEKLIYIRRNLQFEIPEKIPQIVDKNNRDFIVLSNLNRLSKISDQIFTVWSNILTENNNLKMLIMRADNNYLKVKLKRFFKEENFNKLILERERDFVSYLEMHNDIDINLDTYPYNGTTTTIIAAIMGIPTITIRGDSLHSLTGQAINKILNLDDLICSDIDHYQKKIKYFIDNPNELRKIQNYLKNNAPSILLNYIKSNEDQSLVLEMERVWSNYIHVYQKSLIL